MKPAAKWPIPTAILLVAAAMLVCVVWTLAASEQRETEEASTEATSAGTEEALHLNVETVPAAQEHLRDNEALYQDSAPDSVITMYLTVSSGNASDGSDHTWKEINTYSAYDYEAMGVDRYKVEGLLQIDESGTGLTEESFGYGETEPNVSVQIRGQISSKEAQKSYKIRIKKGMGKFRGQRTLNLNKHGGDPFRFLNKICYDRLNAVPQLIGGRTQFVHLFVRDLTEESGDYVDYGLYTMVEQVNRTFLKNHGLDENGQLYKVTFFEWDRYEAVMMDQDDPEFDRAAFETYLEIKGDEDHHKLQQVTADVNNHLKPIRETVEEHFDSENLCYWMAFNILLHNNDTGGRNLFLYSPLNSEKFYVLPWDHDAALRYDYYKYKDVCEGESWERGVHQFLGLRLINRMMREQEYRDMLADAVTDLYTHELSPEIIDEEARRLSAVTKRYLYGDLAAADADHLRIREETVYDKLISQMGKQVEDNYRYFFDTLYHPWPFFVDLPMLNADEHEHILSWGASYDIEGEAVTYDFVLARDSDFLDVIDHGERLIIPSATTEQLSPGTYFLRVRATDESGRSMDSFDYYATKSNGKVYACYCFEILEDGSAVAVEGAD